MAAAEALRLAAELEVPADFVVVEDAEAIGDKFKSLQFRAFSLRRLQNSGGGLNGGLGRIRSDAL